MDDDRRCSRGYRSAMSRASAGLGVWGLTSGAVTVVLMGAGPAAASAQQTASPASLVFDEVTVVDVEQGKLLPLQRVIIVGNRIRTVEPADQVRLPPGAQVVNARGKYLIPGLWDMHAHISQAGAASVYPRLIASGVTGLREMWSAADSFWVRQRAIMAGTRVGPRVIGPSVDVVSTTPNPAFGATLDGIQIDTPEDAARVADSLKRAGMAFIKMHDDFMPRNLYFALARAARRAGIPLVGHSDFWISDVELADSGQRSIEHYFGIRCWSPPAPKPWPRDTIAENACAVDAAAAFVRNGTWITPTFTKFKVDATVPPDADRATADSLDPNGLVRSYQEGLRLVRTLRRLGVTRWLAGTDYNDESFSEIISLEELKCLVDAGLTPLEALQAATLNPAKFFEATDSLGTIAPGKLADLVLLDADPLADISNVMKTRAVVANGRYFDRAALDGLLIKANNAEADGEP